MAHRYPDIKCGKWYPVRHIIVQEILCGCGYLESERPTAVLIDLGDGSLFHEVRWACAEVQERPRRWWKFWQPMLTDKKLQAIADEYVREVDASRHVLHDGVELKNPAGWFFVPEEADLPDVERTLQTGFVERRADGGCVVYVGVFVAGEKGAVRPISLDEWEPVWKASAERWAGQRTWHGRTEYVLSIILTGSPPSPPKRPWWKFWG